jgi:hypothetical protein
MVKVYLRNIALWVKGWGRLHTIPYKDGWSAWGWKPFWVVYLLDYSIATLLGMGCVSLSRWWYDRSRILKGPDAGDRHLEFKHPFSRFMTRALDWAFPGSKHGRHTGPRLWGSVDLWSR